METTGATDHEACCSNSLLILQISPYTLHRKYFILSSYVREYYCNSVGVLIARCKRKTNWFCSVAVRPTMLSSVL